MDSVISSFLCFIANSICCNGYKREYHRFIGTTDLAAVQEHKLLSILLKNRDCVYGKRYKFSQIQSVADYQEHVPLTCYEDYVPYIDQICQGMPKILTEEEVLMLEPTSGSTAASKLIPYTKSLREEFQKGIKPWIYALYTNNPKLRSGKSYWSITPITHQEKFTSGGIRIGFEEDSQYFGKLERFLLDLVFAVPGKLVKQAAIDQFYQVTCEKLLLCRNLSLISIWNPTFLLLLLDFITANQDALLASISSKSPERALELKALIQNRNYQLIWPKLAIISCWGDGQANQYLPKVQALFPDVSIEPKGVLATEAFVSFPLHGLNGTVLSGHSHFFEFLSVDDGRIYLAHQLQTGSKYVVILTTSGGLYRYNLNDVIQVYDFFGCYPVIGFIGKQDKVSDLFGEKLHELFISHIFAELNIADFCMLAPQGDHYVVYTTCEVNREELEKALCENYHYDYCRKLGQLKPLRLFRLTGDPLQEYTAECLRQGKRLGDIKTPVLSVYPDWDLIFKGEYLCE